MNFKKNHTIKYLACYLLIVQAIIYYGCENDAADFILGEEYVESKTSLDLIDTFSVNLSTVKLDTIISAGTGIMLTGIYNDNVFGKISARSYFRVGIPDEYDVQQNDRFDSLMLIIKYNNYSFGDTTLPQRLHVYKLNENIVTDDNGLDSRTTFDYDPLPIGTIDYTPMPNNENDSLVIRLNDNIGRDLFSKMLESSDITTDETTFINYFHGLMIAPDNNSEGNIIGFSANEDSCKMVLYSSSETNTTEINIIHEFTLNDVDYQFNNITHDYSNTNFSSLTTQRNTLPASEIGGLSYLQGITGLVIRVDLPSLSEIQLFNRGKIAEVKLLIAPLQNSYNKFALPPQLSLYETDKINRVIQRVYNNNSAVVSTLTVDDLYQEGTYYSFDITSYINDELSDNYVDPERGLLITLPAEDMFSSFNRLISFSNSPITKLKIYYLSY